MKRNCELCGKKARMYCESDQASLCWECDAKVHSANFLVAKHSRCLLCDDCQSPTPWSASGAKLGTTISVCDGCLDTQNKRSEIDRHGAGTDDCSVNDEDDNDNSRADDDEDSYDEEEAEAEADEEKEGENQVVPWSSEYIPPATSSSITGEESSADIAGGVRLAAKRNWNDAFLDSEGEIGCVSSSQGTGKAATTAVADEEEAATISPASFRASKQQRVVVKEEKEYESVAESKSTSIVTSLARLQNNAVVTHGDATAAVLGIFRLSRYQREEPWKASI